MLNNVEPGDEVECLFVPFEEVKRVFLGDVGHDLTGDLHLLRAHVDSPNIPITSLSEMVEKLPCTAPDIDDRGVFPVGEPTAEIVAISPSPFPTRCDVERRRLI